MIAPSLHGCTRGGSQQEVHGSDHVHALIATGNRSYKFEIHRTFIRDQWSLLQALETACTPHLRCGRRSYIFGSLFTVSGLLLFAA
jgi:hypothetical protein